MRVSTTGVLFIIAFFMMGEALAHADDSLASDDFNHSEVGRNASPDVAIPSNSTGTIRSTVWTSPDREPEEIASVPTSESANTVNVSPKIRTVQFTTKPDQETYLSSDPWNIDITGRLLMDAVYFPNQSASSRFQYGEMWNYAEIRSFRLGVAGTFGPSFEYHAEIDFEPEWSTPSLPFAWIGVKDCPFIGNLRIGQSKAPMGLEQTTLLHNLTFMERSMASQIFTPSQVAGLHQSNQYVDDSFLLQSGVFFYDDIQFSKQTPSAQTLAWDDNMGVRVGIRGVWTPVYEQEGRRLLHIGSGWHYAEPGRFASSQYATMPTNEGIALLDTGPNFSSERFNTCNLEIVRVAGPLSIQSELFVGKHDEAQYIGSLVRDDPTLYGCYVQTGWFLTGEHRSYDRQSGSFTGVALRSNLTPVRAQDGFGSGAWEVAARWDFLDMSNLEDETFGGHAGTTHALTCGLNWYWNSHARLGFNYMHAAPKSRRSGLDYVSSSCDVLAMRLQANW
jgi:phosphate-selective porin OprO and OprP